MTGRRANQLRYGAWCDRPLAAERPQGYPMTRRGSESSGLERLDHPGNRLGRRRRTPNGIRTVLVPTLSVTV